MPTSRHKPSSHPIHSTAPAPSNLPVFVVSDPANMLHNLPAALTRFVGRASELQSIRLRLQQDRLITLAGPGGVGKTRLALQAAWQILRELPDLFSDGIFFVSLSTTQTREELAFAIAETLQIPYFGGSDLAAQVVGYLRGRHILLLLDNFEQLTSAANWLVELLEKAPNCKILVTSRERLNVYGEWVLPLDGLALPETDTLADARSSDAVELFSQSAQRASSDFVLDAQTVASVNHICRIVQGHALALEMAGSWLRVMRCDEIATEIGRDLDFFSADWENLPLKQRSLRITLNHSWDMLEPAERQVFMQLAVFAGHFGREAAVAVSAAALGQLSALTGKSFLTWSSQRGVYDIHPLLRRYGLEKLASDPVLERTARERHCVFWMSYVQARSHALHGQGQPQALKEIVEMLANIRAGWDWAVENAQVTPLAAGLDGLYTFYDARSLFAEGEAIFERAIHALEQDSATGENLSLTAQLKARRAALLFRLGKAPLARDIFQQIFESVSEPLEKAFCLTQMANIALFSGKFNEAHDFCQQARAFATGTWLEPESLMLWGRTAVRQGHYDEARAQLEAAGKLFAAQGNRRGEGICVQALGMALVDLGDHVAGFGQYYRALEMFKEVGDLFWEAVIYDHLGHGYGEQGQYAQSTLYREKSLAMARQIGDKIGEARALTNLGNTRMYLGDYPASQAYFEQALPLFRAAGRTLGEAITLMNLGNLAHARGHDADAKVWAERSLALLRPMQDDMYDAYGLITLGWAALGLGQLDEAESAFSRAHTLRKGLNQPHAAAESLAGLAQTALQKGLLRAALTQAGQIWQFLQDGVPAGVEVFWMYHVVYQIFVTAQDTRAEAVLLSGHGLLQERAAKIADEADRRSFLQNVSNNRLLVDAFSRLVQAHQPAPLLDPLTKQELEIVRLLAQGLSNQAVAEKLVISVGTVKFHVHNLCRKLDAESRTQAVAKAREAGLV